MAKMIPSVISPEVKSNAEKHIFEWFKDSPNTDDWIVLHSLGIANHNRVIHGETDFVVLAPNLGMFVLEVKGGRVKRTGGVWSFTNKYDQTTQKERGPFDQVWDGAFSIIESIKKHIDSSHDYIKKIFWGTGVMFPDVSYESVGCDEAQWQVFDENDGTNVQDYIFRLFEGSKDRWKEVYGVDISESRLPSVDDVKYIASILRGDFDKAVSISVQLRYTEEELLKLTKEQYRCIDQLDDNKRSLIIGGAGTGKTMLAVQEALKAKASGKKVAIFCFNRFLGEWLEKYYEDVPVSLKADYVGTFHKYMIREIKKSGKYISFPQCDDDSEAFYSEVLPDMAKRVLCRVGTSFDKIIVDEAQDLICPQYLDVFDLCLVRGIELGEWTMLGDFSRQAIYNKTLSDKAMIELLEERTSFIRFKLTINCRNTKNICEEIRIVTGFVPPSDVWSKVDGLPVEYLTYTNEEEEKNKLVNTIASLIDNHISPKKITILSPVRREKSIVNVIDEYEIKDYKTYSNNRLSFCTIQAFKGLENSVVILTDIDSLEDRKLMYVAFSRARSGLYVIESEKARQEYLEYKFGGDSRG